MEWGLLGKYNIKVTDLPDKKIVRIYPDNIYNGFKTVSKFQKVNRIENRQRSNNRAKKNIIDLISLNFNSDFTFITLTFRENIQDITVANLTLSKFLQRLKYYLKTNGFHMSLKYIWVLETQKRGALHYHMITNIPNNLNYKDIIDIWNNSIDSSPKINIKGGSVRISHSNEYISTDKVKYYLTKYLTKNFEDNNFCGRKLYSISQNLKKPEHSTYYIPKLNVNDPTVISYIERTLDFTNKILIKKESYKNLYTQNDIIYLEYSK